MRRPGWESGLPQPLRALAATMKRSSTLVTAAVELLGAENAQLVIIHRLTNTGVPTSVALPSSRAS